MRIMILLLSPILAHLAVIVHVFLKYLETLIECCVSLQCLALVYYSVYSLWGSGDIYLVSILKLVIGGLTCEFQRTIKSHRDFKKKEKKCHPPNLILLSKQIKLLHSLLLLQKDHRHLDWNLYTKTIRELPTSYDRYLGFKNFTMFWDCFSIT